MASNIIMTILAVSGINGLLAVLLVIAERFIANYGQVRVTVNESKKLDVAGGGSLLSTLNSRKIFLPSACGGRGTCGYCKCKITEGAGPLLPTESPLLSEDEIENRVRIACQVKVKQDMKIEIPEALFSIQSFQTEVVLLEDLTYDIKRLRLKLIDPSRIVFKPGQYVQLQTQPYNGVREVVSRAYSIASPATEGDHVDLIIRLVPEGICTTWVHQVLKEGDRVTLIGPMGDFQIHGENEEMIMVAGGSGMAPMVSILHELARRKSRRKIRYFFGANKFEDLFYVQEMEALEKKIHDFKFIPTITSPSPECRWQGKTGLITVPLEKYLKNISANAQGYLCGSPGMINACVRLMKQYGIQEDHIYFDPFA